MRNLLFVLPLALLLTNCTPADPGDPSGGSVPLVKADAFYSFVVDGDITYAEGLSHSSINSTSSTPMPLQLDAYIPDNELKNRPAIMLIHGGGFIGGSRKGGAIGNLAEYFASRGWVAFSISYRLRDDKGTVPKEWEDYAAILDSSLRSQFMAIYPAHRDAKAALRWIAANAEDYDINTDYLTVGGGSAGAITSIGICISNFEDFRDEISSSDDLTLATTNNNEVFEVQTILDFWGSPVSLDALEAIYGHQRFDSDDPSIFIAHGTRDATVPFSGAEALKAAYDSLGIPVAWYPLQNQGHGAWNATVDGKRLEELAFDFMVEQQKLKVE